MFFWQVLNVDINRRNKNYRIVIDPVNNNTCMIHEMVPGLNTIFVSFLNLFFTCKVEVTLNYLLSPWIYIQIFQVDVCLINNVKLEVCQDFKQVGLLYTFILATILL